MKRTTLSLSRQNFQVEHKKSHGITSKPSFKKEIEQATRGGVSKFIRETFGNRDDAAANEVFVKPLENDFEVSTRYDGIEVRDRASSKRVVMPSNTSPIEAIRAVLSTFFRVRVIKPAISGPEPAAEAAPEGSPELSPEPESLAAIATEDVEGRRRGRPRKNPISSLPEAAAPTGIRALLTPKTILPWEANQKSGPVEQEEPDTVAAEQAVPSVAAPLQPVPKPVEIQSAAPDQKAKKERKAPSKRSSTAPAPTAPSLSEPAKSSIAISEPPTPVVKEPAKSAPVDAGKRRGNTVLPSPELLSSLKNVIDIDGFGIHLVRADVAGNSPTQALGEAFDYPNVPSYPGYKILRNGSLMGFVVIQSDDKFYINSPVIDGKPTPLKHMNSVIARLSALADMF